MHSIKIYDICSHAIEKSFKSSSPWSGNFRTGRSQKSTIDPFLTRSALLAAFEENRGDGQLSSSRRGKKNN